MAKLIRYLYTGWALLCFIIYFLLLFPFFWLIIQKRSWHRYVGLLNRVWAYLFYTSVGVPIRRKLHPKIDKKRQYVFCANHNSYLDIPVMGAHVPSAYRFVGKSSLSKIPLFGYMFRNLHIPVNRGNKKHSYRSFELSMQAIDDGFSILIFPEGGINDQNPPDLKRFKDGAFRMAIQKQIPLVPVTIPYNWIVLWNENFDLRWRPAEVVFHEPIETKGMDLSQVDMLKVQVKETIRAEMQRRFPEHFAEQAASSTS